MDRDQFDRLSRLVAAAGTRRDALRLLVAGAVAGVAGQQSVSARKRRSHGRTRDRARAEQTAACTNRCIDCGNKRLVPGGNLSKCNFDHKEFVDGLNLSAANVSNACFAGSELRQATFRGANAGGVCFADSDLTDANFRGATLANAVFCGADLSGADFRGSNVTTAQLACATVGCNTILPNGKSAKPCTSGTICCGPVCIDTDTDRDNCGACGHRCDPCHTCQNGQCVPVPNNTVDCRNTALRPVGGGVSCTTSPNTGVCIDGKCSCGFGNYDPTRNVCQCDDDTTQGCAENQPPDCCRVNEVCTNGDTGSACVACG
jgi:hypothetical protein